MENVRNNLDQCSFCSGICNEEFHHVLVPTYLPTQKHEIMLQKLRGFTTQLSSYPTCNKCHQEFISLHNIPERCFQILSSVKPSDIKMEPELMIDDHELSDSNLVFETDPKVDCESIEQEAEVQINGETDEEFFINELDEKDNNTSIIPVASVRHKGEKPFQCEKCDKTFCRKFHLKEHIRVHTDERPYSCPQCPKTFRQHSALKVHIRTHTGECPFPCPHCSKMFRDSSALQRHILNHTGERSYACPHCPKAFNNSPALKEHIRTHTGERPYSCSHCPKSFKKASGLYQHNKTHAGERPHSCPHCPKAFKHKHTLRKHIRLHTK